MSAEASRTRASTRRRLLSAGLTATPVILTVKSRSALAQACNSPSGQQSGNTSPGHQHPVCTPGRGAACYLRCSSSIWWSAAGLTFPTFSTGCDNPEVTDFNPAAGGSSFVSVFGSAVTAAGDPVGYMWRILKAPGEYPGGLVAAELIAAYINAATVPGYPLTTAQVLQMWSAGVIGAGYDVFGNGTLFWGPAEILAYLQGINTDPCGN